MASSPPAKRLRNLRDFFRAPGHWTSAYMPPQENLGGEARKVVLTRGADGEGEEDGADGGNLQGFGETSLGWF
jgi:hypothetical protein